MVATEIYLWLNMLSIIIVPRRLGWSGVGTVSPVEMRAGSMAAPKPEEIVQ
jgi:hypothetical protein